MKRLRNINRKGDSAVESVVKKRTRKKKPDISPGSIKAASGNVVLDLLKGPQPINHFRGGRYLHVSDLIYNCVRKVALSEYTRTPVIGEPLRDSQVITFAQGDAIHDVVKNRIKDLNPEIVYGKWACICGHSEYLGVFEEAREQDDCSKCGKGLTHYHEISVRNDDILVVGSIDLLTYSKGHYYITEIKSINRRAWDELERPKPEHVIQVLMYWWLLHQKQQSLYDQVSILYANKDFIFKSPYKEFTLHAPSLLPRLDPYLEAAREFASFRDEGVLPPRVTCPRDNCPTAKKCQFASSCFSL